MKARNRSRSDERRDDLKAEIERAIAASGGSNFVRVQPRD